MTNVTVNRFWLTDQPFPGSLHNFSNCSVVDCLEILAANAASGFVNTGTVASKFLGFGGQIVVEAADGGITSGTQGSTDQLVGFFADSGLILDSTGKTSLFNVNTGFTTGVTLPFLRINSNPGFGGDVLIDALTPVAQPSSITTTELGPHPRWRHHDQQHGQPRVRGINTTDLIIASTKSFTTGPNGDLGAAGNILITNSGAGGINMLGDALGGTDLAGGGVYITNTNKGASTTIAGVVIAYGGFGGPGSENVELTVNGPLTVSSGLFAGYNFINITNKGANAPTALSGFIESVYNDINVTVVGPLNSSATMSADFKGDVNIINNSLAGGNTTTISGAVFAEHDIFIANNGGSSTNLNISGALTVGPTVGFSDITVLSGGNLTMGAASALGTFDDIFIAAAGSKVMFTGAQTVGDDWEYHGANAMTKLLPAAVITAGDTVTIEALNFTGVNASGNTYTSALEKPAAQIVSNFVFATLYGSMNGPIAGNTNWPLNAMQIKALDPSFPILFVFSAVGGGFQAINIGFTGDAFVSSGLTRTPFDTVGFVSSVLLPPPLVANGGSQLILNATGNLDVIGNGAPFLLAPNAFEFPGGVVLISGGVLTSQVPIYNAWTTNAMAYQGIFKQGVSIVDNSYNATNTNSWVNYSVFPVTGPGNSYRIVQSVPGLFQFILDPLIVHKNAYTFVVTGGAANFCPGGFPPYCP